MHLFLILYLPTHKRMGTGKENCNPAPSSLQLVGLRRGGLEYFDTKDTIAFRNRKENNAIS
jgi:hypothetical protein